MSAVDIRSDGMMSVLNRVANERARFGSQGNSDYAPDVLYASDGIAATIIDRPAEDAVSAGFVIDGDENNDILNEFDRLDAWPAVVDSIRWARLHGGGAILLFVQDGQELLEPLNLDRIRSLDDLLSYPATSIVPGPGRYADPMQRNYGWPSNYEIQPEHGTSFYVHESRLVFFAGDSLPPGARNRLAAPWLGRSALDSCYADLCRYRAGLRLSQAILERKQQLVHKMSDLGNMLAQGLDDVVAKRLGIADSVRGVFNMLAVDAADDVVLADSTLIGIDAVLRDYKIALCASSGIPMPILFGEQTAGLNANSEGELSIYHSRVRSIQSRMMRPAIEKLAGVVWAQQSMRREPQRWQVKFNPLWSPSAKEQADVAVAKANARKIHMESVSVGLDNGTMTAEEARAAGAVMAFPELELSVDMLPSALPDDTDQITPVERTTAGAL